MARAEFSIWKVAGHSRLILIPAFCLAVVFLLLFLGLVPRRWNRPASYYQDDSSLEAVPSGEGKVVFLGDSITDRWNLARYFPGKPYVNRGIGGETTGQILARMQRDVICLHPAACILLAGTNDIAYHRGPAALDSVKDNIRTICELAASHHIKIILCLLTPISDYEKPKQTDRRSPADIVLLNHWMESYAQDIHAEVADYYSALVDNRGMLRQGLSPDGLHPNEHGYELLAPVAAAAIERTLRKARLAPQPAIAPQPAAHRNQNQLLGEPYRR